MSYDFAVSRQEADETGGLSTKIQWLHKQRMGWRYIRFRLQEETERSDRYGHVFSIVFVSAAGLKPTALAREVQHHVRGSDIVCPVTGAARSAGGPTAGRADGGGVAAILPETGEKDAAIVCDRLRRELRDRRIRIGFAAYPHDATAAGELWKLARVRRGE